MSFCWWDSTRRSTPSRTVRAAQTVQRPRLSRLSRPAILAPPPPGSGERVNATRHAQVFVLALLAISVIGAALLALPWVTRSGQRTPLIDAFFTSVSAASVSGLSVADPLSHWNLGGQVVLLVLVQIGGLGFMVGAGILLQMLRRGSGAFSLRDELLLRDGAPTLSLNEAVHLTRQIVKFTAGVEALGTLLLMLWFLLIGQMPLLDALWNGLFYAITAFCNAGFDLTSLTRDLPLANDLWLNLIVMGVAQLGALSYLVCADVARTRRWGRLSLETKIVLSLNGALLLFGAVVFLAAEWGGALAALTPQSKVLAALLQSTSARSSGFNTIAWAEVNPLTLFVWMGLMFVGGASGSTAGGVRLSTVGVILAAVASSLRGNAETQLWGRRIPAPIIFRAVTVVVIFLLIFGAGTAALSIAEHYLSDKETAMIELMFESMSALATVGLSTGITPTLSVVGKLVLAMLMMVGHLGPLITVYALQRRQRATRYRFPEEAVRIG